MPQLGGIHPGVVENNEDPKNLGRVKVTIPNILEPTTWALPLNQSTGEGRGTWQIPEEGAEVVVWFDNLDPDAPYYMRANHAAGEVPPETSGSPEVSVFTSDKYIIVLDDRGLGKASIIHRVTGSILEHSGTDLSLAIQGTTKLSLTSTGLVDIRGAVVLIQGRVVSPSPMPI